MEWDEFCVLMYKKVRETDPENETREAFRVFDAEGHGFIGKLTETEDFNITSFFRPAYGRSSIS